MSLGLLQCRSTDAGVSLPLTLTSHFRLRVYERIRHLCSLSYPLALHLLRSDALYIPRQAQFLHCPDEPPRWIELPPLQAMPG